MSEYIEREDVEKMLEDAQIISDGEYSGYCTEDVNLSNIPIANVIPTKEMVERMRGEWIWHGEEVHCAAGNFPIKKCKQCKKEMLLDDYDNFCPACGAPMTDEAVNMMLKRWKETFGNDN